MLKKVKKGRMSEVGPFPLQNCTTWPFYARAAAASKLPFVRSRKEPLEKYLGGFEDRIRLPGVAWERAISLHLLQAAGICVGVVGTAEGTL